MVRLSRQLFASPIPTEGKPVVKLHLLARIHKFTKARDSSGALLWAFHHFRLASDLLPQITGPSGSSQAKKRRCRRVLAMILPAMAMSCGETVDRDRISLPW